MPELPQQPIICTVRLAPRMYWLAGASYTQKPCATEYVRCKAVPRMITGCSVMLDTVAGVL